MNMELLKQHMDNSQYTRAEIAEFISMNEMTFYRRLKANNFTVNELLKIVELLNLTNDQMLKVLGR